MVRTTGIFPGWTGYFPREKSGEFEGKIRLAHIFPGAEPVAPSRAKKHAWDATLFQQPAAVSQLWELWGAHQACPEGTVVPHTGG